MNETVNSLLVFVVLLDFVALGSSRVAALIRTSALQGAALAVLAFLSHHEHDAHVVMVCVGTLLVKGLLVPALLQRALQKATIRREIEPLIGFSASLLLGALGAGAGLLFASSLPLAPQHADSKVVPAAFATVVTGFLILTTRKKAITQIVGYLLLENGIFLFGLLLFDATPFLVEVGVLLDLVVGVFVAGLLLNHIQRTFSSMDTMRLTSLHD